MRIGVDARCLEWTAGGPARYLINMLKLWPTIDDGHRYVLFFQNRIPDFDYLKHDKFESVLIRGPRLLKRRRIVGEQLLLPFAIRKAKLDLFFTPWYSAPLVTFGVKTVIGAWDISCNTHPSHYTWPDLFSFGLFMPPTCRAAAGLLTCSKFDAGQIEKHFGISQQRMCVVPYAADDKFSPAADSSHLAAFRRRNGLPERYFLSMGIIIRRRNVDVLIDAFSDICARYPDVGLVVIGRNLMVPYVDIKEKLRPLIETGRAFFFDRAPEEDLADFYRGAFAYVCTSTVDGESLMLKEAMRCGTPVITSPLLEETAGGHALMLEDPTNRAQTAAVLERALTMPDLRARYGSAGHEFVASLSWDDIARKSLQFMESC